MHMKSINTLKKLETNEFSIKYRIENNTINAIWKNTKYLLDYKMIKDIRNDFFVEKDKWYNLGASMTEPNQEGLGAFIIWNNIKQIDGKKLKSRDASLIGAIMYDLREIEAKGKRPIKVRKL